MAQSAARVPAWPSSACSDKASRSQSSRLKREQEWARDWTRERLCRWPSGKLWSSSSEPVSATQEDQTWVQNEKDWKDELGLEQLLTVLVLVSPGSASHRPHRTQSQGQVLSASFWIPWRRLRAARGIPQCLAASLSWAFKFLLALGYLFTHLRLFTASKGLECRTQGLNVLRAHTVRLTQLGSHGLSVSDQKVIESWSLS